MWIWILLERDGCTLDALYEGHSTCEAAFLEPIQRLIMGLVVDDRIGEVQPDQVDYPGFIGPLAGFLEHRPAFFHIP